MINWYPYYCEIKNCSRYEDSSLAKHFVQVYRRHSRQPPACSLPCNFMILVSLISKLRDWWGHMHWGKTGCSSSALYFTPCCRKHYGPQWGPGVSWRGTLCPWILCLNDQCRRWLQWVCSRAYWFILPWQYITNLARWAFHFTIRYFLT